MVDKGKDYYYNQNYRSGCLIYFTFNSLDIFFLVFQLSVDCIAFLYNIFKFERKKYTIFFNFCLHVRVFVRNYQLIIFFQSFCFGDSLTYVDLGLLQSLRGCEASFPKAYESADYCPLLKAFKARMEARPKLAAYYKSERYAKHPQDTNSMM